MERADAPKDSALRTWIRGTFGSSAAPWSGLTVRGEEFDSLLLCRGPGSEPGELSVGWPTFFSAQRFIEQPDGSFIWGTAPVVRGRDEELGLRLADGSMVWTQRSHPAGLPRAPLPPPLPPPISASIQPDSRMEDAPSEPDAIAAARIARIEKHPRMREHIRCLSTTQFRTQTELADRLNVTRNFLSE